MFAKLKFPAFKSPSKTRRDKSVARFFLASLNYAFVNLLKMFCNCDCETLVNNLRINRPPALTFSIGKVASHNRSTYHLAIGGKKSVFLGGKDHVET